MGPYVPTVLRSSYQVANSGGPGRVIHQILGMRKSLYIFVVPKNLFHNQRHIHVLPSMPGRAKPGRDTLYPLPGLPIEQVLVDTHVDCIEIAGEQLYSFRARQGTKSEARTSLET